MHALVADPADHISELIFFRHVALAAVPRGLAVLVDKCSQW
jgi:hypothetical protein